MFGIQTLTAFLFAFVVLGVTAAVPAVIAIKFARNVRDRDKRRSAAFAAIAAGLLMGLVFHWSGATEAFNAVMQTAITAGNVLGAYEAVYLPIGFILVGIGLLTFQSGFSLRSKDGDSQF